MDRWQPAIKTPPLNEAEIHVWRAYLDWPAVKIDHVLQLLSVEEQARAKRFVQEKHRRRFVVGHAVLRDILSRYVDIPAEQLQFSQGSHGKPYLNSLPEGVNLQFNMSDSNEMALYSVVLNREVGIDIELMKPDIHIEDIAKRFFSEEEVCELLALPASQQMEGFYRCWTRKEAYIKAIGQGLSFSLSRFAVSLESEGMACLRHVDHSTARAGQWSLGSLPVAEPYAAALAVEGAVRAVRLFEYI